MTIRSTQDSTISNSSKIPGPGSILSQSYDIVLAGASEATAVVDEKREIDTPAAFQTTTPGNAFNGAFE